MKSDTNLRTENEIADMFLKAKHWHLFWLSSGIPLIFQFMLMLTLIVNLLSETVYFSGLVYIYIKIYPILMFLFFGVLFGWLWSVVSGLQRLIPAEIILKETRFKFFLLILVVFMFLYCVYFIAFFNFVTLNSGVFAVIVPFQIFSICCFLYCLLFAAKTLKTAQLKKEVIFSDYAVEFFLILFYPIGIWIIQPKINELIKQQIIISNID
ncbi:MAG: hypothetical protein EA341_00115 [Mongoliibacter sp.]|uniref:hypothetical protein n=1 Tax=Mongoliibacter sp. TaxID=2022438 RepID=UPI0012F289E0|nr:hypothetical protein [Mongoliibacter sp.]TVP54549.1 MAG: hypothetical protein EA341_00115 [Mongoliibacter sp.]